MTVIFCFLQIDIFSLLTNIYVIKIMCVCIKLVIAISYGNRTVVQNRKTNQNNLKAIIVRFNSKLGIVSNQYSRYGVHGNLLTYNT